MSGLIENFKKLLLLFNPDIHSHNYIIRKRFLSFFLVITIEETNPFLNLQKAIVGGIVAAVIVTGDKVTDTECEMGYVKVENVCEETCALTPCKELINFKQNIVILINGSHLMNPDLIAPLVVMLSLFSLSRRSKQTPLAASVSYTHLTLPTNREV